VPTDASGPAVKTGSLIITNQGNYFISIAAGRLTVEDQTWFAISGGSPLGAKLLGKREGDVVEMMGKKVAVEKVA
jgi:hypothetical protein